jgi:outer membrane protein OmpA-like peptidoglycan-associated protein
MSSRQSPPSRNRLSGSRHRQAEQDTGTGEPQQAVKEDPKPQFTADSVLGDDRAASELTDADLRERIRAAEELAANDQTPRRQRRQLSKKLEADKAELNARIAASTGVTVQNIDVSAKVQELVGDNRQASDLSDSDLRERIQATRGLLAIEGLNDRQQGQLREVLARDRQEIRSRVAARDGTRRQRNRDEDGDGRNRSDDLPMRGDQLTLRDLLEDQRPADDLTTSALERRIDANRRALQLDSLSDRQRQALRERMREDRQALRSRYGNKRERRRKRLSDPGFALAVAAGAVATAVILSRPNIAAAEAYDEDIEDWLTAAPLVETKKRYRVEDFRAQPRLRYAVPGIEVDTVRFGFGEGFLREEEIPKLDRIGETIERIVAGNPEEVFLIEGHTDAVGTEQANMKLSIERAQAVKQVLLEYFNIGEDNLATVGRGELYPKIPTQAAEAENRRVSVRRITPLLARN